MTTKPVQTQDKKKRIRSPNFPAINLEEAVKRTREFYEKEDRHWANVEVASKHWGYSSAASGGALVIAALTAFGLLEDEGAREARKVRLSDTGLKIILDNRPNSQERAALLQKAALRPKIYGELWEKWGGALPSDDNIEYLLLSEMGFNRKAVPRFIDDMRHTLSFAGLTNGGKVLETPQIERKIEIGDYVQWESNGEFKFEKPRKVIGFYDDIWARVEGTKSGILISELIKEDQPEESESGGKGFGDFSTNSKGRPQKPGMNQDVYTLPGGHTALVLQWPSELTTEDLEDVELWLEMMKRKLKRTVQKKELEEAE